MRVHFQNLPDMLHDQDHTNGEHRNIGPINGKKNKCSAEVSWMIAHQQEVPEKDGSEGSWTD